MVVNQLFTEQPGHSLANAVAGAFGLGGIRDSSPFTRADVVARGVPAALEAMRPLLRTAYIACKYYTYIAPAITPERCLTILRHFLRASGLYLTATDVTFEGKRTQTYRIHVPGTGLVRMTRGSSVV